MSDSRAQWLAESVACFREVAASVTFCDVCCNLNLAGPLQMRMTAVTISLSLPCGCDMSDTVSLDLNGLLLVSCPMECDPRFVQVLNSNSNLLESAESALT